MKHLQEKLFGLTIRPKRVKSELFDIFKLHGINQYILRSGNQEYHFVLEEDAQNVARMLSGTNDLFAIEEIQTA